MPGSYATVQDAIDAATPGDTIEIDAGTYSDDVIVHVDELTFRGAGADATFLGPGSGLFAFTFDADVSGTVEDLTIDALGQRSALNVNAGNRDLTLRRVHIVDSESMCFDGNDLTIENCAFRDNEKTGTFGGGALDCTGISVVRITPTLFCNNRSATGWRGAVAIDDTHDPSSIDSSVFVGNSAEFGGALWVSTDVEIVNSTFVGNDGIANGGGIRIYDGETLLLNNILMGHSGSVAVDVPPPPGPTCPPTRTTTCGSTTRPATPRSPWARTPCSPTRCWRTTPRTATPSTARSPPAAPPSEPEAPPACSTTSAPSPMSPISTQRLQPGHTRRRRQLRHRRPHRHRHANRPLW